jgi:hypothetical protein
MNMAAPSARMYPSAHTLLLPISDREGAAHLIRRLLRYPRFRILIEHVYIMTLNGTSFRHLAVITYRIIK